VHKIWHWTWNQWRRKTSKPSLSLGAPEPPSNTRMSKPTPLNNPTNSSISSCTSTQLWNKVPIAYNGMPQIHPQNCPFPSTITTPSNTPILDRPHSSSQTASGSNQPYCHNTLSGQTHTQTDRQTDGIDDSSIPWALMLTILREQRTNNIEKRNLYLYIIIKQQIQ